MLKKAPDQRVPTKMNLIMAQKAVSEFKSHIQTENLSGKQNSVRDTRLSRNSVTLCDLVYHLAKTGADPRAPPGVLLEVIPRPISNFNLSHSTSYSSNQFFKGKILNITF